MKRILLGLILISGCISVKAQFPTTDSLRGFINRYIRNSAVEAFQNLRLNTALIGMTNFTDSAYGGQVKSFTTLNDTTVRLITINNDTLDVVVKGHATQLTDSSFIVGNDTITIRGTGGGADGTVTQVNTGYGLTGGPISNSGTIKVDTTGANGVTTRTEVQKRISDSLVYALKSILIPSRLEFINTSDTSTYQNDDLIGSQIMMLSIESYQVGFTSRPSSVYASFDSGTGTITLTNGVFAASDEVIIIYRTPPVFLLDGSGNPVRDGSGNFIILN